MLWSKFEVFLKSRAYTQYYLKMIGIWFVTSYVVMFILRCKNLISISQLWSTTILENKKGLQTITVRQFAGLILAKNKKRYYSRLNERCCLKMINRKELSRITESYIAISIWLKYTISFEDLHESKKLKCMILALNVNYLER